MKKKIITGLLTIVLCIISTGCNTRKNGTFTMTCTTQKENNGKIESQTIVTYTFNKKQLVTEYSSSTNQKFKDKATYKIYKKAQEDTIKANKEKSIIYDLKSDDNKKTLKFKMILKNITKSAKTKEDKKLLKASKILKSNEDIKATCKIDGISKDKLK